MSKTLVVMGQGYVGLPLAQAAAAAGWRVHGYDVTELLAAAPSAGKFHVDDLSDEDIATMLDQGYCATADLSAIGQADVVVISASPPRWATTASPT